MIAVAIVAIAGGVIAVNTGPAASSQPSGLQPFGPLSEQQSTRLDQLVRAKLGTSLESFARALSNRTVRILGREVRQARWDNKNIRVCWESAEPMFAGQRASVREAIRTTWESNSSLSFGGDWPTCQTSYKGIRIRVADEEPLTKGVGNELDGLPGGMTLNFLMQSVRIPCGSSQEQCIRVVAIHEFGHAIGLVHEDYNRGAPDKCVAQARGPSGNHSLTPYDNDSVMNYCTPYYNNNGVLSAGDIASVNLMYP